MNRKVTVECRYCKSRFVQNLDDLVPGLIRQCPNCNIPLRFTAQDIEHLLKALGEKD